MGDPRSKIPQDSWGGILEHRSWIRHIEIQCPQYFNMALPECKICPRSPVQSWILDPPCWNSMCYNISIWPSLNARFLPGVPSSLGSWILDPPYWNSMCYNISMSSCALLGFVLSTAFVTVCMCISAVSKKKKLIDTLPHEPEKIDFWFFGDSRALKQTKMSCFETVQLFG